MTLRVSTGGSEWLLNVDYEFVEHNCGRYLRKFMTTIALGVALGISSAVFMAGGTLLLGHMRPTWMEFAFALPAAPIGFAVGAAVGLIIDYVRDRRALPAGDNAQTGRRAPN